MPLTPNGKADRKALPQPPNVRPSRQDRQPETRLEMILAEVWQDVVGSPPAGVSADFLESGGDSLTFLNLLAAIELRLDVSLPMDGLYDTVLADGITIASLATAVMMIDGASRENLFLTVWQSFGEKPPLFLFPGIGGDSLQRRLLARALGQERPLFIFHRRPNDDLGGGLEDLAARGISPEAALAATLRGARSHPPDAGRGPSPAAALASGRVPSARKPCPAFERQSNGPGRHHGPRPNSFRESRIVCLGGGGEVGGMPHPT